MSRSRSTASFFASLLGIASLMAASAHASKFEQEPIIVENPQYGEALFYFFQEEYFPSIVRLLAAKRQGQLEEHAEDADLLLGGMYLSYGHHLEAAEIFERMLADNVAPVMRDRTWFFLAKIWYQRGYYDKALQGLDYIGDELPDNLRRESLLLRSQILIANGEYDRAIALLSNWDGRTEWASYAKFNIGVALVRSGRVEQAEALLNELGEMNPFNEEMTSLRDKANLALGYALLQDGRHAAAKAPLQRVRLEGPFSNKALLGVGWADAEMGDYRRALVPWMELSGRDLLDSAVQEAMLAIPYAMAELDSVGQAADHYLNAIEAFYEETDRLNRTIEHIESGTMFDEFIATDPLDSTGWYWELNELPEGPESRYLVHLLATHEFQEGLKNFRDLTYLHRNLDNWQSNVVVYSNMLETRKEAFYQRLPRVEDALARADLELLVTRKLEFDAVLNNIEEKNDWLALATDKEFGLWSEIVAVEDNPALQSGIPEAAEVIDKINLLKGVMKWEMERQVKERLTNLRINQTAIGEALVETQRARRQVDEAMRTEPLRFAALGERVDNLAPNIEAIKMRVEQSLSEQRAYLQSIAVGELRAQKQRLDTYTVQARFALAVIYDNAATQAAQANQGEAQ